MKQLKAQLSLACSELGTAQPQLVVATFTLLVSLEVSHYYYPGGGWVGVEIIRIKAICSSAGLAYWQKEEVYLKIRFFLHD